MTTIAIKRLHGGEEEVEDSEYEQPPQTSEVYTAPCFAAFFGLLNTVLYDGGTVVKKDEDCLERALSIITEHCNLRGSLEEEGDNIDEVCVNVSWHMFGCSDLIDKVLKMRFHFFG